MQQKEKDRAEVIKFVDEFNEHLKKKKYIVFENNKVISQQ